MAMTSRGGSRRSIKCALAAIVISAVIGLVDYERAIFLWRVDKRDFTLWTMTSSTTLFFGIEIEVLIGVERFCLFGFNQLIGFWTLIDGSSSYLKYNYIKFRSPFIPFTL